MKLHNIIVHCRTRKQYDTLSELIGWHGEGDHTELWKRKKEETAIELMHGKIESYCQLSYYKNAIRCPECKKHEFMTYTAFMKKYGKDLHESIPTIPLPKVEKEITAIVEKQAEVFKLTTILDANCKITVKVDTQRKVLTLLNQKKSTHFVFIDSKPEVVRKIGELLIAAAKLA